MIKKILKIEDNELDDSIKFRVSYWSDAEALNNVSAIVFEKIYPSIQVRHCSYSVSRLQQHVKTILLNLLCCAYQDKASYIRYSRNDNYYKVSRYNKNNIKARYLTAVVEAMAEHGFVNNYLGYYMRCRKNSVYQARLSRMQPTNILITLFRAHDIKFRNEYAYSNDAELVVLKDKNKKPMEYEDSPKIIQIRKELQQYNEFISKADIAHPYDPCVSRCLFRIFNNKSWKQGGRFYGGFWQLMSAVPKKEDFDKKYRNEISINGNRVVELDYEALHPSILYHHAGLPVPNDVYNAPGISKSIVKMVLLAILNAKGVEEARLSLQSEVNCQNIQLPAKDVSAMDVINVVVQKHAAIKESFFKSKGLFLQFQDSQLTARILKHFTDRDIVILPVHDSYIIENRNVSELMDVMVTEFERQFSFTPKVVKKY